MNKETTTFKKNLILLNRSSSLEILMQLKLISSNPLSESNPLEESTKPPPRNNTTLDSNVVSFRMDVQVSDKDVKSLY